MTGKQLKVKKVDPKVELAQAQLAQIELAIIALNRDKNDLKDRQKARLRLLTSAANGHYEEMDKLSKKAPAEKVTNLALGEINYIISEVKDLLSQDVIIQRYNVFVAAGDNPELRDVVLVLKQLLQGLKRFDDAILPKETMINNALKEAKALREVINTIIDGSDNLHKNSEEISRPTRTTLADNWFNEYFPNTFMYDKLAGLDLEEYFKDHD